MSKTLNLTKIAALAALFAAVGIVLTTVPSVDAHHAFGAEFDPNRPLLLKGVATI